MTGPQYEMFLDLQQSRQVQIHFDSVSVPFPSFPLGPDLYILPANICELMCSVRWCLAVSFMAIGRLLHANVDLFAAVAPAAEWDDLIDA